jgi:hypothetical protein
MGALHEHLLVILSVEITGCGMPRGEPPASRAATWEDPRDDVITKPDRHQTLWPTHRSMVPENTDVAGVIIKC